MVIGIIHNNINNFLKYYIYHKIQKLIYLI